MSQKPLSELETLLEVARRLNELQISYMLTGSLAKTFYATPRMTRDIDVVIELELANTDRVVHAFSEHFYIDSSMVEEAVRTRGMFNLIHNESHVKVDFIVRKEDPYRHTEFSRKRSFTLHGVQVWVVAPEDLILSKLYWAKDSRSEMQMGDIRDLLKSVSGLDLSYIAQWLDHLGVRELYEEVTK